MIDSTNPRVLADNIRHLSGESGSQASDISALQSTVTAQGNAIAAIGSYSTEEVNTGMKYGDSDIYRKTFYIEELPNTTTATVTHGIENLEYLLDLKLAVQRTGSISGRIITYTQSLNIVLRSSDIAITSNSDYSGTSGIVIIEYTKSAAPAALTSPAPDDSRSIENEDPEIRSEVNEEAPEEEPVVETKTTRKKSTSTK